jgi:hypothetical protein
VCSSCSASILCTSVCYCADIRAVVQVSATVLIFRLLYKCPLQCWCSGCCTSFRYSAGLRAVVQVSATVLIFRLMYKCPLQCWYSGWCASVRYSAGVPTSVQASHSKDVLTYVQESDTVMFSLLYTYLLLLLYSLSRTDCFYAVVFLLHTSVW